MTLETICLICGIPASGKTTLSDNLNTYINNNLKKKSIVIHIDDFLACLEQIELKPKRQSFQLAFEHVFLNQSLIINDTVTLNVVEQLSDLLRENPQIVILDNVFYYKSMRKPFRRLSEQYNIKYGEIFVECDLGLAIERDGRRSKPVGQRTIKRIFNLFEEPTQPTNHLKISNEKDPIEICANFLMNLTCRIKQSPARLIQEEEEGNLDNKLRKLVNRLMTNKTNKQDWAMMLAKKKKEFLIKYKTECASENIEMDFLEFIQF